MPKLTAVRVSLSLRSPLRAGAALLAGLVLGACGSTAATTPAASPTPQKPGAPVARFTVGGDPGLAGSVNISDVECQFPGVSGGSVGSSIVVIGSAPDGAIAMRITVSAGGVMFRVDSGSGVDYRERDFSGTNVSGFDAAVGAQIDSPLTESTRAGGKKGTIGTLASVSASIDCMHQKPGSTTVRFTGGRSDVVSGGLTSARVLCLNLATGNVVQILGIGRIGASRVFVGVFVFKSGFNVISAGAFYMARPGATETLTGTGAHVDGDAKSQASGATSADIVHVNGDATCGSTTKP